MPRGTWKSPVVPTMIWSLSNGLVEMVAQRPALPPTLDAPRRAALSGTITLERCLVSLIEEAKAGRVEFRVDKTANLHVPIGKVSFGGDKLQDNMTAFFEVIRKARPAAAKGTYVRRVTIADTMGPGVKVDPVEAQALESA